MTDIQRPQVRRKFRSLSKCEHTDFIKAFTRKKIREPIANIDLLQVLTWQDYFLSYGRVRDSNPLLVCDYLKAHLTLQVRLIEAGKHLCWTKDQLTVKNLMLLIAISKALETICRLFRILGHISERHCIARISHLDKLAGQCDAMPFEQVSILQVALTPLDQICTIQTNLSNGSNGSIEPDRFLV